MYIYHIGAPAACLFTYPVADAPGVFIPTETTGVYTTTIDNTTATHAKIKTTTATCFIFNKPQQLLVAITVSTSLQLFN